MPNKIKAVSVVSGFLVGVGVVAGLALPRNDARSVDAARTMDDAVLMNDPIVGICSGEQVTIDHARRSVPFRLYKANHPLADDRSLVSLWDCPGPQVALEYDSGVVVYLSINTYENPEAVWAEMAATHPEFTVGESRGRIASFADPAKSPNGTAPGGVDLVENGIRLTVSGTGEIPVGTLDQVMESLRQEG